MCRRAYPLRSHQRLHPLCRHSLAPVIQTASKLKPLWHWSAHYSSFIRAKAKYINLKKWSSCKSKISNIKSAMIILLFLLYRFLKMPNFQIKMCYNPMKIKYLINQRIMPSYPKFRIASSNCTVSVRLRIWRNLLRLPEDLGLTNNQAVHMIVKRFSKLLN